MDDADARLTQASGTPVRLAGDALYGPLFHKMLSQNPDVYTLGDDDDPFAGDDPFLSSVLSDQDKQSSSRLPRPVAASSPTATAATTSSGDIATSPGDITSSTGYVFHPAPDVENWRPEERVDYYEAVRQLRFKFEDEDNRPALEAVVQHLKELLPIVHFDDPHTPVEVRRMDASQLEARLATLKALPEEGFLPMSRKRLVEAIAATEDRLKNLKDGKIPKAAASTSGTAASSGAVASPASPVLSSPSPTPDQSPNSTFSSSSSSPPTTPRARRHKNADQDTVSEAQKIPLGKGDYQTIAKTTTVTTVRRGKRPVVQREHTSTTIPGEGGDDDDDDDGALGPSTKRTKRVSRAPKTRARRKRQSQQVGSGSDVIDNIHKYIRYLHERKNEERREKRKRPP